MYLVNEMIINKTIKIDKSLITGLIGGATLTLTIAKGIYTMLHQWSQKKNIYERIKYNEEINQRLEETIEQLKKEKNTWILTNKKDK